MEPTDNHADNHSEEPTHKSGSRIFFIMAIIIILSIAAFLILRPNPSGTSPKNNPAAPANSQQ